MSAVVIVQDAALRVRTCPRPFDVIATIIVAFNLAFAQPLLGLVGGNPAFFVAHRTTPSDLLLLAALLTLVIPLIGAAMTLAVSRLSAAAGRVVWVVVLGGSIGLFAAQLLRAVPVPGTLSIAVAALVGIVLARAAIAADVIRRVARFLSPVALVVAALFLFASPPRALLSSSVEASTGARVTKPAPIVFIMFDEFPVASLMKLDGEIDEHLFPSFARLARDGTWYRNATTVHDYTEYAIPAILSGIYSTKDQPPTASSHPDNLFTLLSGTNEIHATEPVTELCPVSVCGQRQATPRFARRWRGLLSDLRYVALHLELPRALAAGLPAIDQTWANFGAQKKAGGARKATDVRTRFREAVAENRATAFEKFIASIRRTERPSFDFVHMPMPHNPFEYTPEGTSYTSETGLTGVNAKNIWSDDDWLAALAWQRHLLQVRFVDKAVGKLIDHLKQIGTYDDTLIVLTADHGAAFTAGTYRRTGTRQTLGEIAAVPLFVKAPHQRGGGVSDAPVEGMDVLPTIAKILGVEGLWKTDGVAADDAGRTAKRLVTRSETIIFPANGGEKMGVVRRKYSLFAHERDSLDLWRLGPEAGLLGTKVGSAADASGASAHLDDPLAGGGVALIRAQLRGVRAGTWIAVVTDGTVRSVTRAYAGEKETALVALLTPETAAGPISLYAVSPSGALIRLLTR